MSEIRAGMTDMNRADPPAATFGDYRRRPDIRVAPPEPRYG
jgi:hypothetical protein